MIQIKRYLTVFLMLAFTVGLVFGPAVFAKSDKEGALGKTSTEGLWLQFDGNRIATYVTNDGIYVNPWITGQSGMEWPKGSGKTIDFAAGFWLIGLDDSSLVRSASADYSSEYRPGVILPDGTPDDPEKEVYKIYKINKDGTGDWDEWPFDQGAPALKAADGSDSLDADGHKIPGLIGDQMLFFVINDADATEHTNLFSTQPMGVECQYELFGFNRSDQLGDILFVKQTFINKSEIDFDSVYVSAWSDPDMGDASDDLVACDTLLSLGYCYNGLPVDATYGSAPPAIGFDFFQGPEVDGDYLPMTGFVYYWNGAPVPFADPEDAEEAYNFQKGTASDGTPYLDPDGNPNPFVFSGDPVTGLGWLDSSPGDRRQVISSGPFTLASGDTQVIVGAKIIAQGSSALSSVAALKYADQFAQSAFDADFVVVNPPSPKVTGEALDQKIVLKWDDYAGNAAVESYALMDYDFEGYNIYQGESSTGPWTLIGTYDIDNENAVVYDDVFDPESGWVISEPTAFGTNSGLRHHFTVERDYLTGYPLYNYKVYYFAVTSYTVNLEAFPKVIESGKTEGVNLVSIAPGSRADVNMTDLDTGDLVTVSHTTGFSTAKITVQVVDPAELTGHKYQIKIDEAVVEGDTVLVMDLIDTVTGEAVLDNYAFYTGAEAEQNAVDDPVIVDGFKLYFIDTPEPGLAGYDYDGTRWITGVNWGGQEFFGGLDIGLIFFGSILGPEACVPVDVYFDVDTTSGPADGWASWGYTYNRPDYNYNGLGRMPMTAWDVSDPANPRQLNMCFLESAAEGNVNLRWDLGGWDGSEYADPATGGREYVFIMNSDYNPDGTSYGEGEPWVYDPLWGPGYDVLYAFWACQRGTHPYLEDDFNLYIYANIPTTTDDVWEFTPTGSETGNAVTKMNLNKINVVPNPYWGFNTAETTPSGRIIRITNLPADKATIRIFDLAGNLVRVIDDEARTEQGTEGTAYAEWDVRNSADVPVASGIYLIHIEVEGVGEKILKCAVVNREERLLYY